MSFLYVHDFCMRDNKTLEGLGGYTDSSEPSLLANTIGPKQNFLSVISPSITLFLVEGINEYDK